MFHEVKGAPLDGGGTPLFEKHCINGIWIQQKKSPTCFHRKGWLCCDITVCQGSHIVDVTWPDSENRWNIVTLGRDVLPSLSHLIFRICRYCVPTLCLDNVLRWPSQNIFGCFLGLSFPRVAMLQSIKLKMTWWGPISDHVIGKSLALAIFYWAVRTDVCAPLYLHCTTTLLW